MPREIYATPIMRKAGVRRRLHSIDGHVHLGKALMEEGKPRLALDACLRGLAIGHAAMPDGFAGRIAWGFLENRPFLRAAYGAAFSWLGLGKRREAITMMEQLLAWNPDDHQGVRYLIGSHYLRLGETDKAEVVFLKEATSYPPYHYEHGLSRFRAGDVVSAATSLRRGFVANAYIAEMLSGHPGPAPLAIWHGSDIARPETARDYMAQGGQLWQRTPHATSFLRWLFMHPAILIERAAVLQCQEELLWEAAPDARRELLNRVEDATSRIDDALSARLVQSRTDRQGRQVEPWLDRSGR